MYNLFFAARPIVIDSLGVIFFAVLLALGVDPALAALLGVSTTIGHLLLLKALRRPVATLQWLSLVIVLASGSATYFTHDARFLMVKPTIVYAALGVATLKRGWMLRYIPPISRRVADDVTARFGYAWSGLMFFTGAANLGVAVTAPDAWPLFIGTFPLASKIALFAVQFTVTRLITKRRIIAARRAEAIDGASDGLVDAHAPAPGDAAVMPQDLSSPCPA